MTGTDLEFAATLLRKGELVAIPTETVYGLAGNALSAEAVIRIYEVKNRPRFNPMIVHIGHVDQVPLYARHFPDAAKQLAGAFMPGPLTLLLDKNDLIPDLVTAGSQRVALRIPAHPMTRALLHKLEFPLAAPSANPFGYISPTQAAHVEEQLGEKIPYILDGGPCEVGIESTIVGFSETGIPVVYREGAVSLEDLRKTAGEVRLNEKRKVEAPGMLESHYAPGAKLLLGNVDQLLKENDGEKIATLTFSTRPKSWHPILSLVLSESQDLAEAARNLFGYLRVLDASGARLIIAEEVPPHGIGRAINDRLRRAAS